VIRVENVSLRGAGDGRAPRLGATSIEIREGEWVAIAGGNGSGKTTLCRILAGILEPSAGRVEIDGRDPRHASPAGGGVATGVAFQDPDSQFVTATASDEIRFGMENIGLDRALVEARCGEALRLFGLERCSGRNPHSLSGGEKQRLVLASLWSMAPRHLILDEPFSFLDDAGKSAFLAALRGAFREDGGTVVWATVRRDEVDLADRVLFMENGTVRFDGPPAELDRALPRETIERALVRVAAGEKAPLSEGPRGGAGAPAPSRGPDIPSIYIAMTGARLSPGGAFALEVPSFELPAGGCIGVHGPSGAGKTTFLLGCAGLLQPRSGSVSLFGRKIASRRDFPAGRVAYLFQSPEEGFFAATVREEVALGARSFGGGRDHEGAVARSLEKAGLDPGAFLDRSPFRLSEGEKRLVALASALVLEAPLLILDEPTIFLDASARRRMLDALSSLAKAGTSIVVASHDRPLLDSLVDRSVAIERGRVL